MKIRLYYIVIAVSALYFGSADAQTVSFGTSQQGGSNNALASALGKIVNEKHGIKVRVIPMAGNEQYAPMINTGRMDLGISSTTDVRFAHDGIVDFKGRPQTKLRVIASLYPFQVAFFVRKDSPIKSIKDLRGKRVPIKFSNSKAQHRHVLAAEWAAGLTEDDFNGVPVPNVIRAAKDFIQGKLDASWFAVGAGKVKEIAAQVGGIRYLPAETSPEALERMRKFAPGAYIEIAQPSKGTPGVVGPTPVITENYILFAGEHVSADVINKFLDVLYTQQPKLGAAFARWKRYKPEKLYTTAEGLPWHPAAVNWFASKDINQVK